MKKALSLLAASLSVCAFAFNPVKAEGGQFQLERNQDVVAAEQASQGRIGEVGTVERDTSEQKTLDETADGHTDAKTFELAAQRNQAKSNVVEAEMRERNETEKARDWAVKMGCPAKVHSCDIGQAAALL